MSMRRIYLHVTFWIIYTLQDALVGMVWNGPASMLGSGPFWKALTDALLCLVAKFLFTYFVLEVSVPQIVMGKHPLVLIMAEMVGVFLVSIFVYRVIAYYVILPVVYGIPSPTPLISIQGFSHAMMDIAFVAGVATALKFVGIQMRVKENEKHLIREKLENLIGRNRRTAHNPTPRVAR